MQGSETAWQRPALQAGPPGRALFTQPACQLGPVKRGGGRISLAGSLWAETRGVEGDSEEGVSRGGADFALCPALGSGPEGEVGWGETAVAVGGPVKKRNCTCKFQWTQGAFSTAIELLTPRVWGRHQGQDVLTKSDCGSDKLSGVFPWRVTRDTS